MTENEEDLYGDLGEVAPVAPPALCTKCSALAEALAQQEKTAAAASAEAAELRAQNAVLITNISAIFKTAQAELARKDALIADLRQRCALFYF